MDGSGYGERHEGQAPAVDDRVTAAAAELYGAEQEEFTGRRKALADAARTAGDKSAAAAIAALRKPTRAAWIVNQLARADPGAPPRLAALAAALRAAERARDGPRLRELSRDRGALIDGLTERALTAAGLPEPPPSLRAEVEATLTAALADAEVAAAFATGTLTRAAHWSGFGTADFGLAPGPSDPDIDDTRNGTAVKPGKAVRPRTRTQPEAPAPTAPRQSRRSAGPSTAPGQPQSRSAPAHPPAQGAARAAAEEERRAREAAERAARARENYAEAERTVAASASTAVEALAEEERLEAEVRDLEERLIRARADLGAARLTARRAEAAERRARQSLDRLGRKPGSE